MEKPKRESSCLLTDNGQAWKFLTGIKLSSLHPNVITEDFYEERREDNTGSVEKQREPKEYTISTVMACSLCDCQFENRQQQKDHYRLDWHRFNLKRRMAGLKSVSEEMFAEQADDVSSISGSGDSSSSSEEEDLSPLSPQQRITPPTSGRRKKNSIHRYDSGDEDEEEEEEGQNQGGNGRRCPRIYLENDEGKVVSLYRCIVHGKRESPTSHTELISRVMKLLTNQKWAILMTAAGHFAAAVYDGADVLVHKTFHRYVVRAKRGTVQSARDSQGGNAPKSGGASLRRHNEAALIQEVQTLLAGWKTHLDSCTRVFLRVPTYHRAMFYGGKQAPLVKGDPRVVSVPFATRRPTFKELQRVWETLATLECHGLVEDMAASLASPKPRPKEKTDRKKGKKLNRRADEEARVEAIANQLDKQSLDDGSKEHSGDQKENEADDEQQDISNVELHLEEVESSTNHLKEFDTSHVKQKKRKKKKAQVPAVKTDTEEDRLTSELFTVCRTGDVVELEAILKKLKEKFSIQRSLPADCNHKLRVARINVSHPADQNSLPEARSTHTGMEPSENEQKTTDVVIGHPVSSTDNQGAHVEDRGNEYSTHCDHIPPVDKNTDKNNPKEPNNSHLSKQQNGTDCSSHEALHADEQDSVDPLETNEASSERSPDNEIEQGSVEGSRPGKQYFKFLNKPLDNMGYTFLHVAAEDGQRTVLYRLMECGADPGAKNKKGKPAYGCSLDKKTRDEFRRFRANYPERYDYERSQIPAALTEEQEKEKAAKQAERKRNARKAKRAREKVEKEAQEEWKKEDEKKAWYTSLTDREKRALAAEKRFALQTASTSDLQRCWSCGSLLSGKVPFSYMEFKFCSMACLKLHKQQQQA